MRESRSNVSPSLFISSTPNYASFNLSLKCFLKVTLLSRAKPRCFWESARETSILFQETLGWVNWFFYLDKITLCAGFLGSGLKSIFHLYAHRDIKLRSRFKYLADSLRFRTTEKSNVSSANNLAMELSPSNISFIHIENNGGPRMHPFGTPALIGS